MTFYFQYIGNLQPYMNNLVIFHHLSFFYNGAFCLVNPERSRVMNMNKQELQ